MGELEPNQDYKTLILEALENPDYRWRTLRGISKELNIDEGIVKIILKNEYESGRLTIKSIPNDDGELFYTTIEHDRKMKQLDQEK